MSVLLKKKHGTTTSSNASTSPIRSDWVSVTLCKGPIFISSISGRGAAAPPASQRDQKSRPHFAATPPLFLMSAYF